MPPQANAYAMIRRRAAATGIETKLGNPQLPGNRDHRLSQERRHLKMAGSMANHASTSTRTTQLYDRRRDEVSLDEVERIVI